MFTLKNCAEPLIPVHFNGFPAQFDETLTHLLLLQNSFPAAAFHRFLGIPGPTSVALPPPLGHACVESCKSRLRKPPLALQVFRFLSVSGTGFEMIFSFQKRKRSNDPAICRRSIPVKQAFLLRLFAPNPFLGVCNSTV